MKLLKLLPLLCCTAMFGQLKLGKVTVAELQEKSHPTDTSAAAAVLFRNAEVFYQAGSDGYWQLVTEVSVKIKIYKKEGYKFANFEKVYYAGAGNDLLRFYDAATYNLVDGKVERTKLKSDGEYSEQKSKNYKSKKITLPNVREGSVIEYKYRWTTYDVTDVEDFYFQDEIPVNLVRYRMSAPEDYVYNRYLVGALVPLRTEETIRVPNSSQIEKQVTFVMENVPAMKEERYVNNINNYRSGLKQELASKGIKNGMVEHLATTWEDVAKRAYDHDDFGGQLNKTNYFEADLDPLLAEITDRDEKIKVILQHVQSRMAWNEHNGYYAEEGVKTAYKSRTGNTGDINLMLTAMLRHAGLNANPVLVSTRQNGIALFASRTAYNYVIAAVEIEDDLILLDATSKFTQPNILPRRALNWYGRIIRKGGSSAEVNLMPKKNSREAVILSADIAPDGKITGKVRDQYTDYNAYTFRETYGGVAADSYAELLEGKFKGIEISDYEVQNSKDISKPLMENYSFSHDGIAEIIGGKMYVSPLLFLAMTENPFKQEVRSYPVDFVYPMQDKYTISLNIPEGYEVEFIPKPMAFNMEENIGSYKYNIMANGKSIQLSATFELNYPIVPADYYDTLKTFFKEVINKQNEKIVLKKV